MTYLRNGSRNVLMVTCLLGVGLLQACGSTRMAMPLREDPHVRSAIARWDDCVDRATERDAREQAREQARPQAFVTMDPATCEGYRRDVAKLYPMHLETRVEQELEVSERQRWIKARPTLSSTANMPVQIRKLLRAQQY